MSVDIPTNGGVDRRGEFTCAVCRDAAGDDGEFIATYPSDESVALSAAAADGLLAQCPGCAEEVTDLTDAWTTVERPPIVGVDSIAEGYASVARACSFCEDDVAGESVLGVEAWSRRADAPADACITHDNYVLCTGCVPVFAEFLRGISPD